MGAAVEGSGKTVALGIKAPFVGFSLHLTTIKVGDPRRSVKGSDRGGAARASRDRGEGGLRFKSVMCIYDPCKCRG